MVILVCSVLLATGVWTCGDPMPLDDAVAAVVSSNEVFPFKPGDLRGPQTLFRVDRRPDGDGTAAPKVR